MPYHGPNRPTQSEVVPNWVLGGAARRAILERLAEADDGWTGKALELELGLGHAWVFEVLRALRAIGAVELTPGTRAAYRLSSTDPVGCALQALVTALHPYANTPVSRPPRRRRR